ncbi:MAG: hypothetical protein NT118_16845 [Lentisphaerae bacterium]|nr:hypothetical protein [Lentisphaerota bacterium]
MIFNAHRIKRVFCFAVPFIFCLSTYGLQTPPVSAMRIEKINTIISKYKKDGLDLKDKDVVNTILKDVSELYRLKSGAKKSEKTTQDIGKTVRETVTRKFPDSYDTLKKKAETEAEKIFVMSKILDYVSIKYFKGEKTHEAEGCFFSYGSTGNSINIGGNVIAIYDLSPEDRIRFDEGYRNQKKESFVQTKIRDYYSEKNYYSIQVYNEMRDAVIKENEDNGYIFYLNDWWSPDEVTHFRIKEILNPTAEPEKVTPPAKTAVATAAGGTVPTSPGMMPQSSATEDPKSQVPAKEDPAIAKKREEIKKAAEEKQREISTKNAGIDAEQGFDLAYWGMKKDEFKLLYPKYSTSLETGDVETVSYDKGPLSKLEIHFMSDRLYKVVYEFRIGPEEAMIALGRKIRDKYGLTDQEKLDAADPAKANRKEPCASNHNFVDGVCSSCGWTELEVGTPVEQVYTWTGKETKGQLKINLNSEKTAYTDFILSRENPKIKKLADDMAAGAEQKKKREAEEQKKKIIEEYNQSIK